MATEVRKNLGIIDAASRAVTSPVKAFSDAETNADGTVKTFDSVDVGRAAAAGVVIGAVLEHTLQPVGRTVGFVKSALN